MNPLAVEIAEAVLKNHAGVYYVAGNDTQRRAALAGAVAALEPILVRIGMIQPLKK